MGYCMAMYNSEPIDPNQVQYNWATVGLYAIKPIYGPQMRKHEPRVFFYAMSPSPSPFNYFDPLLIIKLSKGILGIL